MHLCLSPLGGHEIFNDILVELEIFFIYTSPLLHHTGNTTTSLNQKIKPHEMAIDSCGEGSGYLC